MTRRVLPTTCVMDCPDTCGIHVEVEGRGEATRVVALRGARDLSPTNGFLCDKVRRFTRRLDHPDRVLHPLRRVGPKGSGRFRRVSWDDAIEEAADRLRETRDRCGGEAILPFHYGGSNGFLAEGVLDDLFFARLGASRLLRTICAVPTTEVTRDMYGRMPTVSFEDARHARCIVIWGANPWVSNVHLVPYLRAARRAGAFVAVVDPVRTHPEGQVDLHLSVRPGTDLPVALSLIHTWREEGFLDRAFLDAHATGLDALLEAAAAWSVPRAAAEAGVDPAAIRMLAGRLASSSPALVRCGWGIERNRNGGRAAAAVLAIPALLGKFGVRGGGTMMANSATVTLDPEAVVGPFAWTSRALDMTRLGACLLGEAGPPVRALFVYDANPAVTVPDQRRVLAGLARDDLFTIVHEQVCTDTARFADLLLPATTFLEQAEIKRSYGNHVLGGVRPVIPPRGEAVSNAALFARLGRAMGFEDEAFRWDEDTFRARVTAALRVRDGAAGAAALEAGGPVPISFGSAPAGNAPGDGPAGVTGNAPKADARGDAPGEGAPGEDRGPVLFVSVFPATPDGLIHLSPACLGPQGYRYEPPRGPQGKEDPACDSSWPLALISPATRRTISSTFGEWSLPELTCGLHPRDAAARSIRDGDVVRVHNDLGEVVCRARITGRLREGVVMMPKGAWRKASRNGLTATALCPSHGNVVGGGACFNDARVEVERA